MAVISIEEIKTKTFHTHRIGEGYDLDEVDDFLDDVTETVEALAKGKSIPAAAVNDQETKELNKTIDALKNETEGLHERIVETNSQNAKLQSELEARDAEVKSLKNLLSEEKIQMPELSQADVDEAVKAKQQELDAAVAEREAEIAQLKSELAEAQIIVKSVDPDQAENLQKQVTELQEANAKADADLQTLNAKVAEYEAHPIEDMNREIENLKSQVAQFEDSAKADSERIAKLEEQIAGLEADIAERDEKLKRVAELEEQIAKFETVGEEDAKKIQELENELHSAKGEIESIESEVIAKLKADAAELEAQNSKAKEEIEQLQGKVNDLEAKAAESSGEAEKIADMESAIESKEAEISDLAKRNEILTAKAEEAAKTILSSAEQIASLTSKIEGLNDVSITVETLRGEISGVNAENARLKQASLEETAMLDELRSKLSQAEQQLSVMVPGEQIAGYQERIDQLTNELQAGRDALEIALAAAAPPEQIDTADLEARIADLNSQLDARAQEVMILRETLKTAQYSDDRTHGFEQILDTALSSNNPEQASLTMLTMAKDFYEGYVRKGKNEASELISNAEIEANELVENAKHNADSVIQNGQREAEAIKQQLEEERAKLQKSIDDLKSYEIDYRERLRRQIDELTIIFDNISE